MSLQWAYLNPIGAALGGSNQTGAVTIPLDSTGTEVRYDVRRWATFGLHAVFSPTASTGVLTVYRSIDGVNVAPLESGQTITTSDTMLDTVDVSGVAFIIVRVTTADASDTVSLFAIGKASE